MVVHLKLHTHRLLLKTLKLDPLDPSTQTVHLWKDQWLFWQLLPSHWHLYIREKLLSKSICLLIHAFPRNQTHDFDVLWQLIHWQVYDYANDKISCTVCYKYSKRKTKAKLIQLTYQQNASLRKKHKISFMIGDTFSQFTHTM